METNHSYCKFTNKLAENNLHKIYHNTEYGFPVTSDKELFGRLILEINQAGLSWDIILKKKMLLKRPTPILTFKKWLNIKKMTLQNC